MLNRHVAYGLGFIAFLVLVVAGTVGSYRGSFRDTIEVHAVADRAGLTLEKGGQVKFRGLQIGTVHDVRSVGDHVEIDLRIERDHAATTPSSVTAQIIPPTAFGAKYVQLTATDTAEGQGLEDGQSIRVDHVGTEVNTAFANLSGVLEAARPRDVAGAISAVAGSVDGQGARVGSLIEGLNSYLAEFNRSLPVLEDDLGLARDVLGAYRAAAPDIAALARDGATVSSRLRGREKQLSVLVEQLDLTASKLDGVVVANSGPLADLLELVLPVSAVLGRYAPELPCVIEGAVRTNGLAERAVGGTEPGITTYTELLPPTAPYDQSNLPRVADRRGPDCRGLPGVNGAVTPPAPGFLTGVSESDRTREASGADTAAGLFGTLTSAVLR